jgi:hypothetical protein
MDRAVIAPDGHPSTRVASVSEPVLVAAGCGPSGQIGRQRDGARHLATIPRILRDPTTQ